MASPQEIDDILALTLRINDFLCGLFLGIGIKLVDFKLEFGRILDENSEVRIILADEISPDTCRLWDMKTKKKMDKDITKLYESHKEGEQFTFKKLDEWVKNISTTLRTSKQLYGMKEKYLIFFLFSTHGILQDGTQ